MELLKDHQSTKVSQHQYPRVDVLNNMLQSLGLNIFLLKRLTSEVLGDDAEALN